MDLDAARSLGISRSTLYRWRTGATRPSRRMRELLARSSPAETPFESDAWVRAVRRNLGLGQADFGRLCGVSQASVSKWENGGLALEREDAAAIFLSLELAPSLEPATPEPCQDIEDAARRYSIQSSSLIIQSGPDADWRAAQFCSSLCGLASRSVEAGRILAAAHANRSLWHLFHQNHESAARHAIISIRLGRRCGLNVESGYAFWSLARTRFFPGFGSSEDLDLLDREMKLAGGDSPKVYWRLLKGARAMALGDEARCATELARAQDSAPSESEMGVVGRWGEAYWQRDITMYHGMLALCTRRYEACCRILDPLADEPFDSSLPRQYGQTVARHYVRAARARLGSRETIETDGPLLPAHVLDLVRRQTARLAGFGPMPHSDCG